MLTSSSPSHETKEPRRCRERGGEVPECLTSSSPRPLSSFEPFRLFLVSPVRDRVRTKMERDILVEVSHPFIVKLHYGESQTTPRPIRTHDSSFSSRANILRSSVSSNFPPSFSVPDGGEALPYPGFPQGRRSLHASLQGGNVTESTPLHSLIEALRFSLSA